MSTHGYDLTGLRIAGMGTPLAGPYFEGTEPPQLHNPIITECILDLIEKLVDYCMNNHPLSGDPFRYVVDNFCFCEFRGCHGFLRSRSLPTESGSDTTVQMS